MQNIVISIGGSVILSDDINDSYFDSNDSSEYEVITLQNFLKLKIPTPTHIIQWYENKDPFEVCCSIEDMKERVRQLLKNPNVSEKSIVVYEVKRLIRPKMNISFK